MLNFLDSDVKQVDVYNRVARNIVNNVLEVSLIVRKIDG